MNTALNTVAAIVVENFVHTPGRQMLVARLLNIPEDALGYLFINTSIFPVVDFGDTILLNIDTKTFFVYRGNSHLTFKLSTYPLPIELFQKLVYNRPTK